MARPPDPARRDRTLAGATDYVLEHGLADLSLRPLATALGTSTRMLLYDFGSRSELVTAILAEARRRETALLEEYKRTVRSPAELLRDVWAWISAPEREPYLRLFFEVYVDSMVHPSAYPDGRESMVTDWLRGLTGTDDATLAIAVIRGLLLDRLHTGDTVRTDRALADFTALLAG